MPKHDDDLAERLYDLFRFFVTYDNIDVLDNDAMLVTDIHIDNINAEEFGYKNKILVSKCLELSNAIDISRLDFMFDEQDRHPNSCIFRNCKYIIDENSPEFYVIELYNQTDNWNCCRFIFSFDG